MNRVPERDYAEVLLRRGMPATMLTPAGRLPAVVVFLSTGDSWPDRLRDAFGGIVMPPPPDPTSDLMVWVGVGRSGTLATLVATREIGQAAIGLRLGREEAWRAMLAFARLASANPPDATRRRPHAVYSEMRRLADRIDRLLEGGTSGYSDIVSGLAQLISMKIEDGTLADDLRFPMLEERDR